MELIWLGFFAFLAGFVDAVAGGGGLIQLPALLIFLPPALAADLPSVYGTNKLSSICGTSMAVWQYSRKVSLPWRSTLPAALAALFFSFLGARMVVAVDPQILRWVILILLSLVTVWVYGRKSGGAQPDVRVPVKAEVLWAVLAGAGLGFYDGFFGPGTGSFLIFVWVSWLGFDFLTASANAKVVNLATNVAAIAYFAATDHIYGEVALVMGCCNLAGGFCGSRLALLKGNQFVRKVFLAVVVTLMARLAWDLIRGI